MLNAKSFLAVDFGAGSLKLATFDINEAGVLCLKDFRLKSLGTDGAAEATREANLLKVLRETLAETGSAARSINVCAPGFQVFSKFVKLPPVDAGKVTQIIQYEAQQNVPFPLAEVVWDYQILGSSSTGELEVLLVAIKSEIVEGLFRIAEEAKLRLQLCDVSPAALCNAFRYNYGDLEDCTLLLDIGAKTSNLLFFEKGKVFARSINLGANSITQDFANEAKLKFEIAEQIKMAEGFVSLGGAYEEPENPNQAAIAKIARQFMTKLHIQVNQTIQFYRGQMGGAAPQRLFLAGGASIMPYTAQFFAEKLNAPVEYFNPFRNVQIDPAVNLEELARVAHSLGEVVGLGLRNLANCPVEMNLMPESTLRWRTFNEKKPYFMATIFSLVAVAFAVGFLFQKLAKSKEDELEKLQPDVQQRQAKADEFNRIYSQVVATQKDADQIAEWMNDRYYWGDVLSELRRVLIRTENDVQKKLSAERAGVQAGIWIEQFTSMTPSASANSPTMGGPPGYQQVYGMPPAQGMPGNAMNTTQTQTNQVGTIGLVCRAVSLAKVDPAANSDIAYTLENELQASPYFDPKATQLTGQINAEDTSGTFTFGVSAVLKNPLNL
ncbi:MAG TPA: type IV pilus assembly protein PilM [Candidatus Saccharimonadales bacterium]|nr:type IV pilus assembly protein PilM [Candidatus Saccharimonadales bacterium]